MSRGWEIFIRIISGLAAVFATAAFAKNMMEGYWFWAAFFLALAAIQAWLAIEETPDLNEIPQFEVTLRKNGRIIIHTQKGEFTRLGLSNWVAVQCLLMKMRMTLRGFSRITMQVEDVAFLRRQLREFEEEDGPLPPVCAELVRRRIRQLEEGR